VYDKVPELLLGCGSARAGLARWLLGHLPLPPRDIRSLYLVVVPIRRDDLALHGRDKERDSMAKQPTIGTITSVFDKALDGLVARLVRRRKLGYTVELLESKDRWHKGDIVHLGSVPITCETLMHDMS
jgi:hypothetical protein